MKRLILSVIMIITAVIFSGCGTKTTMESANASLNSAFECDMKIVCESKDFEGKLRRMDPGIWEAEFTAPDTLAGVVLSFSGNDVSASYKGLAFTVPKKAIPVKSILLNLITAVDTVAAEAEIQGSEEDGIMTVSGENESGEYKLCIDSESGNLVSFEMKNLDSKLQFENMMRISQEPVTGEAVSETAVS